MRVPITGIGIIAPDAIGLDAFRALLASGRSAVAPIDRFDTSGLAAHSAALVRDFKPRDFIAPMKMRRMSVLSRLAFAAAKLAIDDHGAPLPNDSGVALGTAFGTVQTSVEYMSEYVEKGASLAPPQLFAESVANAPGSHIAIEHDLRGFNITVTQRESSALAAAMYASSQIVKGSVPAALFGGVDEVSEMIFSVIARLGALSDDPRPFDASRNGYALGEGSAVFITEREPSRTPYAYLSGFGIGRDTTATTSDWGTDDEKIAEVMRAAIDDAEISPSAIDAIYASANGSRRADAVEANAIARLFGDTAPRVVATKQIFGEYAAAGGLQLAAAVLATAEHRHVLVNSLSAGGGVVCAVVSREAA